MTSVASGSRETFVTVAAAAAAAGPGPVGSERGPVFAVTDPLSLFDVGFSATGDRTYYTALPAYR